jgi:hypothetical protein
MRLSELSKRLVDLSHASTQRLPGAGEASCGHLSGQGLLGMAGAELLEAADELQHLLLEGRQLTNGLLLEVWGPQVSRAPKLYAQPGQHPSIAGHTSVAAVHQAARVPCEGLPLS